MLPLRRRERLMTLMSLFIVGAVLMAPTTATTRSSAANGKVTLKIMQWQYVNQARWWTNLLRGFTVQHPNVTIENEYVTFDQYLTTLESEAAANTLPDVFYTHVKAAELGRSGHTIDFATVFPSSFFKQFKDGRRLPHIGDGEARDCDGLFGVEFLSHAGARLGRPWAGVKVE